MRWFRRRQPPRPPESVLTPAQEGELREVARSMVGPGFAERDEVLQVLLDHDLEGVGPAGREEAAERVLQQEWDARRAELGGRDGGDHDRLARAFDRLSAQGVLGRMAFTCCLTCGTAEIDDERTPVDVPEGEYRWAEWAYTFFHQQDAERLAEPGAVLLLAFSAFRPAPDTDPADLRAWREGDQAAGDRVREHTDVTVGRVVASALEAEGLEVTWDGSATRRIEVAVPEWRKPLPV